MAAAGRAITIAAALGLAGCSSLAHPTVANVPTAHPSAAVCNEVPYPVVLAHGFAGFSNFGPIGIAYFNELERLLREEGVPVSTPPLPPYQSSEVRARYLAQAVDELLKQTGAEKVHIIAHSQGGLDGRYLVNVMGYGDRVATLTTVATPHRGTPLADQFQHVPPPLLQSTFWVMASINGAPPGVDLGEIDAAAALHANSTAGMREFNSRWPDDPRVPIFSLAAVAGSPRDGSCDGGAWGPVRGQAAPQLWLTPTWSLLGGTDPDAAVANDGVVPAASARWGTFLGCIPVDHIEVVGAKGVSFQAPDAVDFDQPTFWKEYLARLRGIEQTGDVTVMTSAPPRAMPKRKGPSSDAAFLASR